MIEKMKHISVVCRSQERSSTLDRLGELGIVHVVDVRPPQSDELERLQSQRSRVEDALKNLPQTEGADDSGKPVANGDPVRLTEQVVELLDELEIAEENEAHWRGIREKIKPWGGFPKPLLNHLQAGGLQVRLLQMPIKGQSPDWPEAVLLEEINRDRQHRYLLLVAPPEVELPADPAGLPLPEETDLQAIDQQIRKAVERESQLRRQAQELAAEAIPVLKQYLKRLDSRIEFARARAGMGEAEAVCYLQGYIPAASQQQLQEAARQHGWGVLIQAPGKDDTRVPTKIRLARWVEPIRLVFQTMGIVPGYREIDISAWFMVFLSIFFALLFGDAGYGGLFLIATLALRKAFPKAPSQPFWLFGVFAVCTVVWGVLTGTYFGIQQNLWGPLAHLKIDVLTDDTTVQKLCFLLGTIHLSIAHLWNAAIHGRSLKTLAELAWIAILWGNFQLAMILVVGIEEPPLMLPMYAVGLGGVILFSNPDRNPLKMAGGGIGALLLGGVNSFVDVVSYIRLYAVGAATVAVADSFNKMAQEFMLPGGVAFLIGALILLFGHSLNIVLGLMSVLVHGVRLNVLEFSQHLGLQWTGTLFRPLRRDPETVEND